MKMEFSWQEKIAMVLLVPVFVVVFYAAYQNNKNGRGTPFSSTESVKDVDFFNESKNTFANPPSKEVYARFQRGAERARDYERNARRLFKAKQLEQAEAESQRAIQAKGKINGRYVNTTAYQLQGEIRLAQNRYRDALLSFQQASRFPQYREIELGKALAYCGLKEWDEARKHYAVVEKQLLNHVSMQRREYIRQNLPGTRDENALKASIFYALGEAKSMTGRDEEAMEDYQVAHQLEPRNFIVAFVCGQVSLRLQQPAQALRYYSICATFGNGEIAEDAKRNLGGWPKAKREAALREAAKLR